MSYAVESTMKPSPSYKTLVEIKHLYKRFPVNESFLEQLEFKHGRLRRNRQSVHAINDVSLRIKQGKTLCVVGESGCGKSTVARVMMGLLSPTKGSIHYDGQRIDNLSRKQLTSYRRRMQMIFQNPYSSLNPRMTVQQTLQEPVRFHNPDISNVEVSQRVGEIMRSVGIDPAWINRYPHEFSGGQRQRISIGRALSVDPEFIVADEPISALDVSIQAQILNLMMDAQIKRHLTYMFITHDLSVVEHFGYEVAVMYLGTICEWAKTKTLFSHPKHPYTRALLSAIPSLTSDHFEFIKLKGEVPTPIKLPAGCVFHNRCQYVDDRCRREIPQLSSGEDGGWVACHGVAEGRID